MSKGNNKYINKKKQENPILNEYYCNRCGENHNIKELCPVISKRLEKTKKNIFKHSANNIQYWGSLFFECLRYDVDFYEILDEIATFTGQVQILSSFGLDGGIVESSEFILSYFASCLNKSTKNILHTTKYLEQEFVKMMSFEEISDAHMEDGKLVVTYEIEINNSLCGEKYDMFDCNEKRNIGFSSLTASREYCEEIKTYVYSLTLNCGTRFQHSDMKNPRNTINHWRSIDMCGFCQNGSFTLLHETEGEFANVFEKNLECDWDNDSLCEEINKERADRIINELLEMNEMHRMEWNKIILKNGIHDVTHLSKNEEFVFYDSELQSLKGYKQHINFILHHKDLTEHDMHKLKGNFLFKDSTGMNKEPVESCDFAYFYIAVPEGLTWRYGLSYVQMLESACKQSYMLYEENEDIKTTMYSKPDERLLTLAKLIDRDISFKDKIGEEFGEVKANIKNSPLENTIGFKEVSFHNIICKTSTIRCRHEGHNIKDYTILIPIMTYGEKIENREIKIYKTYAGYCANCGIFFMFKNDYNQMLKQGQPLCKVIDDQSELEDHENVGYRNFLYKSQSVLFNLGYNVQQQCNLTDDERKHILEEALKNNFVKLSDTISFLGWLIRTRESQKKYQKAIEKWKTDLEFLKKYKEESRERIVPSTIIIK